MPTHVDDGASVTTPAFIVWASGIYLSNFAPSFVRLGEIPFGKAHGILPDGKRNGDRHLMLRCLVPEIVAPVFRQSLDLGVCRSHAKPSSRHHHELRAPSLLDVSESFPRARLDP